jgi:hypothetical protein
MSQEPEIIDAEFTEKELIPEEIEVTEEPEVLEGITTDEDVEETEKKAE